MITCINLNDEVLTNFAPSLESFSDVGMECEDRFRDGINSDELSIIILFDAKGIPLGYCSYFFSVDADYRNLNDEYITFYVHYVYMRKQYRGNGASHLISNALIKQGIEIIKTSQKIAYYTDASLYNNRHGKSFGNRVIQELEAIRLVKLP